jgi:hypothetical protein
MLKLEVSLALFGFPAHFTYKSPNILPHIDLAAKVKLSYPPRDAGQSMLELTSKPLYVYGTVDSKVKLVVVESVVEPVVAWEVESVEESMMDYKMDAKAES